MTSVGDLSPEQLDRQYRTEIQPLTQRLVRLFRASIPEGWGIVFIILPREAPTKLNADDPDDLLAFGSTVDRPRAEHAFRFLSESLADPDCPRPE